MLEAVVHLWMRVASQLSTHFPVQNLPGAKAVDD